MLRHRAAPGQGLVVVQRACARGGVGPGLLIARACSVDSRTCRRRLTVEALDQQHVAPSDGDDVAGGRMPHSATSSSIACSTRALFHSSSGRVNLASHSPSSSSTTVFWRSPCWTSARRPASTFKKVEHRLAAPTPSYGGGRVHRSTARTNWSHVWEASRSSTVPKLRRTGCCGQRNSGLQSCWPLGWPHKARRPLNLAAKWASSLSCGGPLGPFSETWFPIDVVFTSGCNAGSTHAGAGA